MIDAIIDLYHRDVVHSIEQVHASGIIGCLHKVSEGGHYADPAYSSRDKTFRKVLPLWGAYHFGRAGYSGRDQAAYFLKLAKPAPETRVAFDWEDYQDSHPNRLAAESFVVEIFKATGRYPFLYSSNVLPEVMQNSVSSVLSQCPLWLARYGVHTPRVPNGWTKWTLWQYTETGHVPGIVGNVDRNRFDGTVEQLIAVW